MASVLGSKRSGYLVVQYGRVIETFWRDGQVWEHQVDTFHVGGRHKSQVTVRFTDPTNPELLRRFNLAIARTAITATH